MNCSQIATVTVAKVIEMSSGRAAINQDLLKQGRVDGDVALGEFSAALYFAALRGCGCDPFILDGAIYSEVGEASMVRKWAATYDLDGAQRLGYARALWDTRAPGVTMIDLG